MGFRIFASVIAALLLIAFVAPVVVKLKEVSLIVVVVIGLAMMLTDLWESIKSNDR